LNSLPNQITSVIIHLIFIIYNITIVIFINILYLVNYQCIIERYIIYGNIYIFDFSNAPRIFNLQSETTPVALNWTIISTSYDVQ